MMRNILIGLALAGFFSAALVTSIRAGEKLVAEKKALTEKQKIESLIKHVETMRDAVFVRNGRGYNSSIAATFLRRSWEAKGTRIKTAQDFIQKVGSAPSNSARPYLVRFKNGKEKKAGDYLAELLKKLEQPTAAN